MKLMMTKTCSNLSVGIGYPHAIKKNVCMTIEKTMANKHDLAVCKYAEHKEGKTKQDWFLVDAPVRVELRLLGVAPLYGCVVRLARSMVLRFRWCRFSLGWYFNGCCYFLYNFYVAAMLLLLYRFIDVIRGGTVGV